MKLKKIASLALTGVMAVSMLAACGQSASNPGNGDDGEGTVVVPTTAIVDAVNKGQAAGNVVKVNFTDNTKLDAALKQAVETYGNSANGDTVTSTKFTAGNVSAAITKQTGLKTVTPHSNWVNANLTVAGVFLNGSVQYASNYTPGTNNAKNIGSEDGKTYSLLYVKKIDGVLDEQYVLNQAAAEVNSLVAQLANTSDDKERDGKLNSQITLDSNSNKYYTYTYNGSISMVSATNLDGTTSYYVAFYLAQDIAKAELK